MGPESVAGGHVDDGVVFCVGAAAWDVLDDDSGPRGVLFKNDPLDPVVNFLENGFFVFFDLCGFGCGMECDGKVAILGPFGCQNFETEHVWLFNSKVVDFQLALVGIQSWAGSFPFREPDDPGILVLVLLGSGIGLGAVELDWGDGGGTRRSSSVRGRGLLSAYFVPYVSSVWCVLGIQGVFCILSPV